MLAMTSTTGGFAVPRGGAGEVTQALLQSGFLRRTSNGGYVRADVS